MWILNNMLISNKINKYIVDTAFCTPYNLGPCNDVEILRSNIGLGPNQITN